MTSEMLKYVFDLGEEKAQIVLNLIIQSNLIIFINDVRKLTSQVPKKEI